MSRLWMWKRGRVALGLLAAVAAFIVVPGAAQAVGPGEHTQKEVNEAVEKGVAYIDTQQNVNGSYGAEFPFAETGMALVAYGVLANGNFESLSATYQAHVKKAVEWLEKEQNAEGYFGFPQTYDTGTSIAGLESVKGADAGVPAAIKKGREFLEGEFKGEPNFKCSSADKSASASWCGGWNYEKTTQERSDESNTGFAMFGLHQTGGVPAGIAEQDVGWQHHVQSITSNEFATRNDGGAGYVPSCASVCGNFSSNANDSGSMLFGLGYDGVAAGDEHVKAGIKFGEDILNLYEAEKAVSRTMVWHNGASEDGICKIGAEGCDWFFGSGEGGYHYSLFSLTKGLGDYIPPALKEASNWYAKVVDLLLTQQEVNGSWPADLRDDGTTLFATALSVGSLGLVGVPEVKTSLSGEAKSGEKITVKEESSVTDTAMLEGSNVKSAEGEVTYKIYSDNECTKLVKEAGKVKVAAGVVPPSEAETLEAGTYYWQAFYTGDEKHNVQAANSKCGNEVLTVEKVERASTCGKTTIGKSSDQLISNLKRVNRCVVPFNATVSELVDYLAPTSHSGSQTIKGVIYADSKGKPVGLLGTSLQFTFTSKTAAGWYKLVFPVGVKLVAGNYWIGIITGSTTKVAGERWDSVKNAEDYNANTYTAGASNPFGSFKVTNEEMSLYATFKPSGG